MQSTKYYLVCGKLKKDITLADRVYSCSCWYSENRDIHAARNMILLGKSHTYGTGGNQRLWRERETEIEMLQR